MVRGTWQAHRFTWNTRDLYNVAMLKLLLTALLIVQWPTFIGAQTVTETEAPVSKVPRVSHPLPFKTGEVLTYEVNFSKLILSGTIGELKIWVATESPKEKGS